MHLQLANVNCQRSCALFLIPTEGQEQANNPLRPMEQTQGGHSRTSSTSKVNTTTERIARGNCENRQQRSRHPPLCSCLRYVALERGKEREGDSGKISESAGQSRRNASAFPLAPEDCGGRDMDILTAFNDWIRLPRADISLSMDGSLQSYNRTDMLTTQTCRQTDRLIHALSTRNVRFLAIRNVCIPLPRRHHIAIPSQRRNVVNRQE